MTEKLYNIKAVTETDTCELSAVAAAESLIFTDAWSAVSLASSAADPSYLLTVAVCDGAVAGYLIASFVADESELLRIAVLPTFRHRGAARALMAHYMNESDSRGVTRHFLEVRESNTAAVTLYESFGFNEYTRRRAYYRDPLENARLMMRVTGQA